MCGVVKSYRRDTETALFNLPTVTERDAGGACLGMFCSYARARDPAHLHFHHLQLWNFGVTAIPPTLRFNENNIVGTCGVYLESVNW